MSCAASRLQGGFHGQCGPQQPLVLFPDGPKGKVKLSEIVDRTGEDVEIDIDLIDETNTRVNIPKLIRRFRRHDNFGLLALVGVLQTVPSLALLAMLIPLLGMIGTAPALLALRT